MRLIRQTRLRFTAGKSDKVYEVDLVAVDEARSRYLVNFRYGRFGSVLREGSKTSEPVDIEKATRIFEDLIAAKQAKGYQAVNAVNVQNEPADTAAGISIESMHAVVSSDDAVNGSVVRDDSMKSISGRALALQKTLVKYGSLRSSEAVNRVDRALWRLGELPLNAAEFCCLTPTVITLFGSSLWMRNYCLAWYFGRHATLAPAYLRLVSKSDSYINQNDNNLDNNQDNNEILRLLANLQRLPEQPVQRFAKAAYGLVQRATTASASALALVWVDGTHFTSDSLTSDSFTLNSNVPKQVAQSIERWLQHYANNSIDQSNSEAALLQHCVDAFSTVTVSNDQPVSQAKLNAEKANNAAALVDVYCQSQSWPELHRLVLKVFERLPLQADVYRAIRHCFKLSELFKDHAAWGMLSMRFTTTPGNFSMQGYGYVEGVGYIANARAVQRSDTKLAYSKNTHHYFQKRIWRYLRRMAQDGNIEGYVTAATEYLLTFNDADAQPVRRGSKYRWVEVDGEWENVNLGIVEYPAFAKAMPLYHILRGRDNDYETNARQTTWMRSASSGVAGVAGISSNNPFSSASSSTTQSDTKLESCPEPWPEHWDQHPKMLLRLLLESQFGGVQQFASQALKRNALFCERQSTATWLQVLNTNYTDSQRLAFEILSARYAVAAPEREVILGFLNCDINAAQQQACGWIEVQPHWLKDNAFVLSLMCNRQGALRQWAKDLIKRKQSVLDANCPHALCEYLFKLPTCQQKDAEDNFSENSSARSSDSSSDNLLVLLPPALQKAVAQDIGWLLVTVFCDAITITEIGLLLAHNAEFNQAIAARLLIKQQVPAARLSTAVLFKLIESTSAEVRALGVELFGQLSDQTLAGQTELLLMFCLSDDKEVRQAVRLIILRLCHSSDEADNDFIRELPNTLVHHLIGGLFSGESSAGVHEDLLSLLSTLLFEYEIEVGSKVAWRLLHAKSYAAQDLGIRLMNTRLDPQAMSVKQWTKLASHKQYVVREWACKAFENNPQRSRDDALQTLRLLDSDWQDTREFAQAYLKRHFDSDQWSPELLISICDSTRQDVQQYGRGLIAQFFDAGDGVEYLLKLSQHPSIAVQLFATQYLQEYAAGQSEHILTLELYFITVLSQVNRGSVAKSRVQSFLLAEAKKSQVVAEMVAAVFARQTVTSVIEDKAAYLEGMRDIQKLYPFLSTPVVNATQRVWSKKSRSIKQSGSRYAV